MAPQDLLQLALPKACRGPKQAPKPLLSWGTAPHSLWGQHGAGTHDSTRVTAPPGAPPHLHLSRILPSRGCLCPGDFICGGSILGGSLPLHHFTLGSSSPRVSLSLWVGSAVWQPLPLCWARLWAACPRIHCRHPLIHCGCLHSSPGPLHVSPHHPLLANPRSHQRLPWGSLFPARQQQLGGVQQPVPTAVLPLQGTVHQHSHLRGWGQGESLSRSPNSPWGATPPGPTASGLGCPVPPCASTAPSSCSSSSPSRRPLRSWSYRAKRYSRAVGCGAHWGQALWGWGRVVPAPWGTAAPRMLLVLTLFPCHVLCVLLRLPQAPHRAPQQPGGIGAGGACTAPAPQPAPRLPCPAASQALPAPRSPPVGCPPPPPTPRHSLQCGGLRAQRVRTRIGPRGWGSL